MNLSHIINHLGEEREQYFRAVSPPIIQTSNFAFGNVAQMRESLKDELNHPFYTRGCNPTVNILRQKIAALEHAEDALVFSSGSAAIAAAVLSQLKAGDHVVCVAKPYSWTNKLLNKLLVNFAVQSTMIDGVDVENYARAIRPNTRLFILESPNSLTFELQDIAAVAALARAHGITTMIDNSYASPLYQSPILMGIDIVTHSATKYLNGHSDVVAGVLCSSKKIIRQIFESEYMTLGGILSPHDAALLLRGLRTLPLRMARVSETTAQVVAYLEKHPVVERVYYPFSPSFPQYELAKQQMKAGSGLFSILIRAEKIEQVEAFCNALRYFLLACSWGGHESLAFPLCVLYTSENYVIPNLPWNLVRLSIGLEDADTLIEDLNTGFEALKSV